MNDQTAAADLPPEKVITFEPISLGDSTYETLTLQEPTAGQLEEVDAFNGVAWSNQLVSKVSGTPLAVVRKLPVRKLNEASAYLSGFIGAAR